MQVKDLGESGLLELFRPFCYGNVGDDAALLGSTLPNHSVVVTTDMLVEGFTLAIKLPAPKM